MKHFSIFSALITLYVFLSPHSYAAMYSYYDENGVRQYSNQPPEGKYINRHDRNSPRGDQGQILKNTFFYRMNKNEEAEKDEIIKLKSKFQTTRLEAVKKSIENTKIEHPEWVEISGFRDIKFGMDIIDLENLNYKTIKFKYKDENGPVSMLKPLIYHSLEIIKKDTSKLILFHDLPYISRSNQPLFTDKHIYKLNEIDNPQVFVYTNEKYGIDIIQLDFTLNSVEFSEKILESIRTKYKQDISYYIYDDFSENSVPGREGFKYETAIFNLGSVAYDAISIFDGEKTAVYLQIFYLSPEISEKNLNEYRILKNEQEVLQKKTSLSEDILNDL